MPLRRTAGDQADRKFTRTVSAALIRDALMSMPARIASGMMLCSSSGLWVHAAGDVATAAAHGDADVGRLDGPRVIDAAINLSALAFSAGIGVMFGHFPARRAARMDPIEARRHEQGLHDGTLTLCALRCHPWCLVVSPGVHGVHRRSDGPDGFPDCRRFGPTKSNGFGMTSSPVWY